MTKQTRYFLLGSAGVLAVGLGAGLVAYYGGFSSVAFSQSAPDELRYVPAEASVVAYANVREVMTSQVRQRFRHVEPEQRERQEFEQKTGINVETDIDYVVAALMPRGQDEGGLILLRGRFNETQLESFAREEGGSVETYKDRRVLRPTWNARRERHRGERPPVIGLIEAGLVAVGDEPSVRRAIDLVADGGADITSNEEMMRLVRDVSGVNNAWAVGRLDTLARRAELPPEMRDRLPAVQWFAAGGRLNGGVVATVRAEARDEEAAQNLRDVVRGFLALAKLQGSARPELQTLLQSIELGGTGTTVALSISVPLDVIEAFASEHHRRPAER